MNHERWEQIEALYHHALKLEPAERPAFLNQACAGDGLLHGEVESLISYDESAKSFIEAPAVELVARQMAEDRVSQLIGQQIGSYRIISRVGVGGMGEVYLAEDATLDRRVAIKFLSLGSQTDDQARSRLIREAQAAAKLDHPNVCAIHEVGRHQDQSFIVMQYVEGETLAARIKRGRLEAAEAINIAIQTAGALSEAHANGIIHRDIKPQNIMITRRSQVKVLDFGLAKLEPGELSSPSEAKTQTLLTQPGIVPGTVPYMSPEQLRGETLDARTDIFSLGVVLYEMLTGERPFQGGSPAESISAILEREPPLLAERAANTSELQPIVSKCLEKNRERRYSSVKDLEAELTSVLRSIHPDYVETRRFAATPGVNRRARSLRWLLAIAGLLLIAVIGAVLYMSRPADAVDSLAVLPFATEGADPNVDYLGEGIPERIISKLAELQSLKVIASTSSFKYKGDAVDMQAVGNKLGVRAVLNGRVTRRGDSLFINAELVDVRDARLIWGEQYFVRESDLLGFEERISQTISEKLRLRLTGPEKDRLARRGTDNPEAHQHYLKGRAYMSKLTLDSVGKATEQFQQAIQKDPRYALAYAGLADCYTLTGKTAEARDSATEALRLDDSLGEAHASRGFMKWIYDWDWKGAEAEYKRAIELNPNSPFAHERYALLLGTSGRHDEAIREARRAQEIDPVSADISVGPAQVFALAHKYEEAEQELKKTLDMDPGFQTAHAVLSLVYEGTGRYKEAIEEYRKIIDMNRDKPAVTTNLRAGIGRIYARWGNTAEALKILGESSGRPEVLPYVIAQIHAALGDRQHALDWLDKAYQSRDVSLLNLKQDPTFESLHQERRFVDLLRYVGLEP